MPMIPKDKLDEFKRLCREQYGLELTDAETLDKAIRFLHLVEVVLRESAKHDAKYR